MAGFPVYTDLDCSPIVDHPHERLHQHNTFLGVIGRKNANEVLYPNRPDVDVGEFNGAYVINLEVPGVKDAEDINIRWAGSRALLITGTVTRPWATASDYDGTTSPKADSGFEDATFEGPASLMIGERRLGRFRRVFHFPHDVDMSALEAKLNAGLLHVILPKKKDNGYQHGSSTVKVEQEI